MDNIPIKIDLLCSHKINPMKNDKHPPSTEKIVVIKAIFQ